MEENQIIQYIISNNLNTTSRKRIYIDPRNYLIGVLYYKHGLTEEEIASIIKRDRTTINYSKDIAYHLRNNSSFLKNTIKVRQLFPCKFTKNGSRHLYINRKRNISFNVTEEEYLLLRKLKRKLGIRVDGTAVKTVLFTELKKYIGNG